VLLSLIYSPGLMNDLNVTIPMLLSALPHSAYERLVIASYTHLAEKFYVWTLFIFFIYLLTFIYLYYKYFSFRLIYSFIDHDVHDVYFRWIFRNRIYTSSTGTLHKVSVATWS
jgi:hypothetical protein